MIIQAELKCKQTGCEADPCAVDKILFIPEGMLGDPAPSF